MRAVAPDGLPIAGAQIYVVPERNLSFGSLFEHALPFVEEPRRLGSAGARGYLADAKGEARVVRPAFDAFLLGFAEDRRGAIRLLEPTSGAIELRFESAVDLVVQVVDGSDAPVRDVRVATGSRALEDPALDRRDDHRPPLNLHQAGVRTDERGLARLVGCDLARARHAQITRFGKFAFCVAVPYLGSGTRLGATDLDEVASSHGPVRVRLEEPFGAVEVRVVDRSGAALVGEATIDSLAGSNFFFDDSIVFDSNRFDRRPLEKGVARFVPVDLGKRFGVSVRLEGGGTARKTVDGPTKAGELVRVELDPQRDRRFVRGRLAGVSAPPTATLRLTGEIFRQPEPLARNKDGREIHVADLAEARIVPVATDLGADCSFEIDVTGTQPRNFLSLELRGFDREHLQGFVARAAFPEEFVEPVTDLGEIMVAEMPVLARGRIVDDLGRPIPQAVVAIARGGWPFARLTTAEFGPRTTSDADGLFALVGTFDASERRLHFAPPAGFATAILEPPPDDREREYVLPRTGRIVGTLATDFDVCVFAAARAPSPGADALSPPVHGAGAYVGRRDENQGSVASPLTFELRPGRYEVLVTTTPEAPRNGVVAWVPDVEVRPAEVTVDPRLAPLSVTRGQLAWRIHLARSDGAPPPSAWVRLAPADAPNEPWRNSFVATGEATFESALETAWIDVDAVSFRRVRELHGRGDVTIVLEPLEQRDLEIALDAGDAPHCYDLHWTVAADSSRPLPSSLRDRYSTTVQPGGTAELALDEGEAWKIRLFAQIDAGGAPRRVELERCMQQVSTRGDASETPARITFKVHVDEVDALWNELTKSERP